MCYHQLELEEKFYQFYNDFFSFWPKSKNNKQKLAYKLIFLLSFDFKKIYFQILFLPLWQKGEEERQSLPTCQNCRRKYVYFTE